MGKRPKVDQNGRNQLGEFSQAISSALLDNASELHRILDAGILGHSVAGLRPGQLIGDEQMDRMNPLS